MLTAKKDLPAANRQVFSFCVAAAKSKEGPSKLVVGENDLATAAPKVTAMLSEKTSNLRLKLLLEATENSFLFALTANKNLRLKLKMSFIL